LLGRPCVQLGPGGGRIRALLGDPIAERRNAVPLDGAGVPLVGGLVPVIGEHVPTRGRQSGDV
jgi:hypothetical protein